MPNRVAQVIQARATTDGPLPSRAPTKTQTHRHTHNKVPSRLPKDVVSRTVIAKLREEEDRAVGEEALLGAVLRERGQRKVNGANFKHSLVQVECGLARS